MSAAYMLIGPAPFLERYVANSVHLSLGVAAMIGTSWSLVAVSSFTRASRVAARLGYCDDMNTNLNLAGEFELNRVKICHHATSYFISSALWLASFHLGSFLGPTISGFVIEAIGFRSTAVTFMVISLTMFVANLAELGVSVKSAMHDKVDYELVNVDENEYET